MAFSTRVIIVEVTRGRARAALVSRDTERVRVLALAEASHEEPRRAAVAAIEQLAGTGRARSPVHVITRDVTAACLEWPQPIAAGELAPDRLRELVRWEIEPLVSGEGEIACAWSEVATTSPEGHARRLAFGVRRDALDAWRVAIARTRHSLTSLYPASVCALAHLGGRQGEVACLLDVREDLIGCVRVRGDTVEAVRLREREPGAGPVTREQALELMGPDVAVVHLVGEPALVAALRDAFGASGGPEERALAGVDDPLLASILGVARHALGLPGAERIGAIAASEPEVRLHHRPWARAAATGSLVLAVLALVDLGLARTVRARRERAAALQETLSSLAGAPAPVPETRPALAAALDRLEEEQRAVAKIRASEDEILRNDPLGLALLDALAQASDDDVSLERIAQTKPGAWRVHGFALSDSAVQKFATSLGRALTRVRLDASLLTVRGERGRLAIPGWAFELGVTPVGDATADADAPARSGRP